MGTETTSTENPAGTESGGDEFKPITSQADLDKLIGERVKRERAKFSDYPDLKAKAAKFDEAEAASKSELEKVTEAAAKATKAADDARADALRMRIAAKHGISDEDADLFLTGRDEQSLNAQAERLANIEADRKKQGGKAPTEKPTAGKPEEDEMRAFTRNLFGKD